MNHLRDTMRKEGVEKKMRMKAHTSINITVDEAVICLHLGMSNELRSLVHEVKDRKLRQKKKRRPRRCKNVNILASISLKLWWTTTRCICEESHCNSGHTCTTTVSTTTSITSAFGITKREPKVNEKAKVKGRKIFFVIFFSLFLLMSHILCLVLSINFYWLL